MSEQTRTVFLGGGGQTLKLRKYRLTVLQGPDQGTEEVFAQRTMEIGSSPDADFVLDDSAVSRAHARIEVDGAGYHVRDQGSKNGTWIGQLRVGDAFLEHDSTFRVGESLIRFQTTPDEVDIHFSAREKFGDIIGGSMEMRRIFALLERVAPTDATILVEGESGTGKELVANAIHENSNRAKGPLVVFDCSAVPRDLIESELFGHVRGAFTGATANRKGAFEQANGGTLFLDELGELDLDLQPKLLRILETMTLKPVGGTAPVRVDVRIVAATNRTLIHEVRAGNFREDLYYRFEVIKVVLPPLRDRKEDIPQLLEHFLGEISEKTGRTGLNIGYSTMEKLKQHTWPGNVRELRNFVERAALLADGDRLETQYLNLRTQTTEDEPPASSSGNMVHYDEDLPFKEAKSNLVEEFEKRYWTRLLRRTDGNVSKAARLAGVHRKSVEYILKKIDIQRTDLSS
jgi:transcriptional regulator with GAF, ATPase, and Fis domain